METYANSVPFRKGLTAHQGRGLTASDCKLHHGFVSVARVAPPDHWALWWYKRTAISTQCRTPLTGQLCSRARCWAGRGFARLASLSITKLCQTPFPWFSFHRCYHSLPPASTPFALLTPSQWLLPEELKLQQMEKGQWIKKLWW